MIGSEVEREAAVEWTTAKGGKNRTKNAACHLYKRDKQDRDCNS